jgi:hypothetical protein
MCKIKLGQTQLRKFFTELGISENIIPLYELVEQTELFFAEPTPIPEPKQNPSRGIISFESFHLMNPHAKDVKQEIIKHKRLKKLKRPDQLFASI